MRFLENLKIHALVAFPLILLLGSLSGFVVSILLAYSGYFFISFPAVSDKIAFVVFLTSVLALVSVAASLPFLIFSALLGLFSFFKKISLRRYYVTGYLCILALFVILLWLHSSVLRLSRSPLGYSVSGIACVFFAGLFVSLNLVRRRRDRPIKISYLLVSMILIPIYAFLAFFSYGYLKDKEAEKDIVLASKSSLTPNRLERDGETELFNIILISLDTLRADHLSCYGYERETSPHIDEFAAANRVFKNAYSPAPWTLPAHGSVFTGLYPSFHDAYIPPDYTGIVDALNPSNYTLAEMLKDAGYDTAGFASCVFVGEEYGFGQGFDIYDESWKYSASEITQKGIDWLEGRGEKPFFLFLHFMDIHNYESPPPFDHMYVNSEYDGKLKDAHFSSLSRNEYYRLSEEDLSYARAKYDGAIRYVDAKLAELFNALKKQEKFDSTFIIVFSDHGEEFWEHGGTGHSYTLYNELLKVALIIKLPGKWQSSAGNNRINDNVALIDIVPTLLDYLGLKLKDAKLQGISLRKIIEGESEEKEKRYLFAEASCHFNERAVFSGGWKYINNRVVPADLLNPRLFLVNCRSIFNFGRNELFRIDRDPCEKDNLIDSCQGEEKLLENKLAEYLLKSQEPALRGQETVKKLDDTSKRDLKALGYLQ